MPTEVEKLRALAEKIAKAEINYEEALNHLRKKIEEQEESSLKHASKELNSGLKEAQTKLISVTTELGSFLEKRIKEFQVKYLGSRESNSTTKENNNEEDDATDELAQILIDEQNKKPLDERRKLTLYSANLFNELLEEARALKKKHDTNSENARALLVKELTDNLVEYVQTKNPEIKERKKIQELIDKIYISYTGTNSITDLKNLLLVQADFNQQQMNSYEKESNNIIEAWDINYMSENDDPSAVDDPDKTIRCIAAYNERKNDKIINQFNECILLLSQNLMAQNLDHGEKQNTKLVLQHLIYLKNCHLPKDKKIHLAVPIPEQIIEWKKAREQLKHVQTFFGSKKYDKLISAVEKVISTAEETEPTLGPKNTC